MTSRAAAAVAAKQTPIEALTKLITPPLEPATLPVANPDLVPAGMLVKVYDIVADAILGVGHTPEAPGILKGRVTRADLEAAGVDFEWLLKTEAIIEAGYAPTA